MIMTRKEILTKINNIIKEDFPCNLEYYEVGEDNLLTDSNMDSYTCVMFWLEVQHEFNLTPRRKLSPKEYSDEDYSKWVIEYTNKINYKTYKVKHLINRIVRCM